MRKTVILVLMALFLSTLASADRGTLEASFGYFYPVFEEAFQDIYGGGLTFGGDLTINIWRNIGIRFGFSSFSGKGELTFTQEDTQLSLATFVLGGNYTIFTSPMSLYVSLGARLVLYKESNVLGDVDDLGIGIETKVGIYKKLLAGLFADLHVGLSYCQMQPAEFKINVGGLEAGVAIGYAF